MQSTIVNVEIIAAKIKEILDPASTKPASERATALAQLFHEEGRTDLPTLWKLQSSIYRDAAQKNPMAAWDEALARPDFLAQFRPASGVAEDCVSIYGQVSRDILDREIEIAWSKKGESTHPGKWQVTKGPLAGFLALFFGSHDVGAKDGLCFLQGPVIDGERKNTSVPRLYLVVQDLDTGDDPDVIRANIRRFGWFAVVASTHSHLKSMTEVKQDAVANWAKKDHTALTAEDVSAYLMSEKSYRPHILEGATIDRIEHTAKGVTIFLRHKPMPKMRILLVLKDPFVVAERKGGQKGAIQEWKERYAGVAKLLGCHYDRKCSDLSRLFFSPRHPADANEWFIDVIAGEPVDLDSIECVTDEDPWDQAHRNMGGAGSAGEYKTEGLGKFCALYADRFNIVEFIEANTPDDVRGAMSAGPGSVVRCPFEDDTHSPTVNGGPDMGCYAIDAQQSDTDAFVWNCSHDSCNKRNRLHLLDKYLQENGLTVDNCMKHVFDVVGEEEERRETEEEEKERMADRIDSAMRGTLGALPSGFTNRGGYLCFVKSKDDPGIRIASAITVRGHIENQDTEGAGILISYTDARKRKRETTIKHSEIVGDKRMLLGRLAHENMWIDGGDDQKTKLVECLSRLESDTHITVATRPGWHGDGTARTWLSPLGEAIGPNAKGLRLAKNAGAKDRKTRGSPDKWKESAAAVCSVSDRVPQWLFAVCHGFAGPLVGLCDLDSMGAHFSGSTTRGKTTAQRLQAAVVGNPKANRSVLHPMRASDNSMEDLAEGASGSTVAFDEAANIDSRMMSKVLFMLSGGRGKARKLNSGAGLRPTQEWAVTFSTSNEFTLRDVIAAAKEAYREGISARTINIDMSNVPKIDAVTMAKINLAETNYGHAAPAFIRYLFDQTDYAADGGAAKLENEVKALALQITGDGGQQKAERAALVLALAWKAGLIAQAAELLPAQADVGAAIKAVWTDYVDSDGGEGASLKSADGGAVEGLLRFCAKHRDYTILPIDQQQDPDAGKSDDSDAKTPTPNGLRPYRPRDGVYDETYIYLFGKLPEITEVAASSRGIAGSLKKAGYLVPKDKDHVQHSYHPKLGYVRHYKVLREAVWPVEMVTDGCEDPQVEQGFIDEARKARGEADQWCERCKERLPRPFCRYAGCGHNRAADERKGGGV